MSAAFVFPSCVHLNTASTARHLSIKSDDHIICRLTRNETPAILAQIYLDSAKDAWIIEDANPDSKFRRGDTIVIPLKIDNKAGIFANGYQSVPILCYHRFAPSCASELCVPEKIFYNQMKYLKDNDYRVISLKTLIDFLQNKKAIPQKSVVVTIDDGYRSVYEVAYPILKKFGFTATLFIYTEFVAGGSALTWDQIREMKAAGFEIGSHTISHSDLSIPKSYETSEEYLSRVKKEIFDSKTILDKKLDQDTIWFAYPFGRINSEVIDLVQKAGYQAGFSVTRGGNPFPSPIFNLRRDQILTRNPAKFARHLKTFYPVDLREKSK